MDKNITKNIDIGVVSQEIRDIYVGAITQSHLILLDGYHQIGQLILALPSKYEAVKQVARLSSVSSRTLYNCAQFAEKYPDISKLPEGDNTTWTKMVKKYLPETTENKKEIHRCTICGGDLEASCHTASNGKL